MVQHKFTTYKVGFIYGFTLLRLYKFFKKYGLSFEGEIIYL